MKKLIAAVLVSLSLSACVSGGGAPANKGAALTSAESAFVGDWSGKLPSGKPVRLVVAADGAVRYFFQGQPQSLWNVKLTASRLSMTVGKNGSTVIMSPSGAYVFTWGPTGQVTRATLSKG
ncbi:hypothetical protein [Rhizobium sp. NFR03]|uniref:hypothetical protein n=1 Tax=Rhizobium sp. NFR03 TaxID=1566263 RepID=UPI0008BF8A98|nr:hypothetical protein [Rhizobium sp. NFR03]SER46565.1 hypothetical protein SAMN03159406_00124 [Rhizobium sp. NFR03]